MTTRLRYFETAMAILAEQGQSGLRIAPLCRALGVTSGSFYHHFGSLARFTDALLEHWEAGQTRALIELTRISDDPWERVRILKHLATTVPHEAEAAIRAWSRTDPVVGRVQRRVDDGRRAGLREVIVGVGVDDATAARLAWVGIALLAGAQQVRSPAGHPVDRDELLVMLTDFEHLITVHAGAGLHRPE